MVRDIKALLSNLWDKLFPPLPEDSEADDEIIVQPDEIGVRHKFE